MTNKKSVGYTGSTPIEAGAFYAPYIPLQTSQYGVPTWQDNLRNWTTYFSEYDTGEIIKQVYDRMQKRYPGAYSVVIEAETQSEPIFNTRYGTVVSRPELLLRLDFANPADETWFRLQHG